MRNILATIAVIGMCFVASTGFAATVITIGTISQFTGPGDLDLDGNIVKATNFNGPDTTVAGVTFESDAGDPDYVGPQNVVGWQTKPEYGNSSDDDNLEAIMHDIRWANSAVPEFVEAHIPVIAGELYKLQILISGNHPEFRVWDIEWEGIEAVDSITSLGFTSDTYDMGRSTVYTLEAPAIDDVMDIRMGQVFGQTEGDDLNPIWQALTLELVPEPSTGLLILLGSAVFVLVQRRRRSY